MRRLSKLFLAAGLCVATTWAEAQWPQFRGPGGDGHAGGPALPLTWSETNHVQWKTAIRGKGWSSPVISGDRVWLTTANEEGTELSVIGVDRDTGRIVLDRTLFEVAAPQFCHKFNSYASPTPVVDSGHLYVTFGSPGTACIDIATGSVLWERRDLPCNHYRGAGSSPILWENLLILHFDGSDHQYVVALDAQSGRTVWRQERSIDFRDLGPDGKPEQEGDLRKAFATPHVATFNGHPLLISSGAKAHYGYDPRTGRELWRVEDRTSHSASARPVVGEGLVFILAGWPNGHLLAIRPGSGGDVVDANATTNAAPGGLKVAWKVRRNVPRKPSPLLAGELLFLVDDGGIASCLEARTGQEIWRERIGGNYSAAPLYSNGRIYCFSEEGKATVLDAGRTFRALATNELEDGFMASPAAAEHALYLRTRTHLYRIEDRLARH
jgi:outer membrane protein assembly factor BamB